MGNQHSSNDGDARRPFGRHGGALGLSRTELDKRCQPSGLYDNCQWEDKAIRRLVGDGKLATRLKGSEYRTTESIEECPICFLYYGDINVAKCCSANLCTECYLQVRTQKDKHSSCPFCNNHKLSVTVAKKLSADQIQEREEEEQRVDEARIRARNVVAEENDASSNTDDNSKGSGDGFGSSLQQDSRVALLRARSESMTSSTEENANTPQSDDNIIKSLAMTPEERRRLEDEMRAQHSHPVALRLEAEAQERRAQNDRAYSQSQSGSTRDLRVQRAAELFRHGSSRRRGRGPEGRDWNQIVAAFERGGNGEVQSLDDLVVLEAAILLSMEEDARRARTGTEEADTDFDAARHAQDGFPLVRSFLANRGRDDEPATQQQMQNLARSLHSSRRRNQLLRAGHGAQSARGMADTALDMTALLMRGVSEEEQMAMAIAASLHDQTNDDDDQDETEEDVAAEYANGSAEMELDNGERAIVGVIVEGEEEDEPMTTGAGNQIAVASIAVGVVADDNDGDQEVPTEPAWEELLFLHDDSPVGEEIQTNQPLEPLADNPCDSNQETTEDTTETAGVSEMVESTHIEEPEPDTPPAVSAPTSEPENQPENPDECNHTSESETTE